MERRNFIKIAGLSSLSLMIGNNVLASNFKDVNHKIVEIKPPNVHVRHGLFNIYSTKSNNLCIQRDIFNKNGLEQISEERMSSIKISEGDKEIFGTSNKKEFKSKSNKLTGIKLSKNKSYSIDIDSPSLIFSEFDSLYINEISIKNNQAFLQNSSVKIKISSETNQFVFVYKINA